MTAELLVTPSRATDPNSSPYSGAKWYFYVTGTTTPQSVYTTAVLDVAHANPVVADSGGKFPNIFFDASLVYRGICRSADDAVTLHDIDPINSSILSSLSADGGAGIIGTADSITVQQKLDEQDLRLDDVETVTPTGEASSSVLADLVRPFAFGSRPALVYGDPDSVNIFGSFVVMGGFRFRGQYTKARAPLFALPSIKVAEYNLTGCPELSAVKLNTWVAAFAVSNDNDANATLRTLPFLRVGAPTGNTMTIIAGGENVTDLTTAASHSWSSIDNLSGAQALIISENGAWSGKTATITGNTTTSITLDNVNDLAAGDFILPSPPGWDHFVYLGSFFYDGAEVRNFYDSGNLTKAKMVVNSTSAVSAGSIASPTEVQFRGNIPPLATALVLDSTATLSTTSTGDYAEYFAGDGSDHTVQTKFINKSGMGNLTFVFDNVQVPFLYHQTIHYSNAGTIAPQRIAGQLEVTGWIEP